MLFDLCTLWVGGGLSYIERLSLTSMLAQGHKVKLFAYDVSLDVPEGVETIDAAEILPHAELKAHEATGSLAVFSDLFRCHLLQRGHGCWVDADIILLRPIERTPEPLFGFEKKDLVNNAVLFLPPDHPILEDLFALWRPPFVAPWWPLERKIKHHALALLGVRKTAFDFSVGTTGPRALTYFVQRRKLAGVAQDTEVFYPIPLTDADCVFDPAADPRARFTDRTICTHLWNSAIAHRKSAPPPAGSFLELKMKELGVAF